LSRWIYLKTYFWKLPGWKGQFWATHLFTKKRCAGLKTLSLAIVYKKMPVDESSMSETAQKAISKLRSQIDVQKELIKKEEAIESQKGDTYIVTRAKATLESAERKMLRLDDELEAFKRELDERRKKLENTIAASLAFIEKATTNKTPTTIRAETTIASLREKVEKILNGWNVDIVIPDETSKSNKPVVDWNQVAKQQLAQMTPAERQFFEESKNRVEQKEEVYMYNGDRVSKFEYDLFTKQDAEQLPREKYAGPKKACKKVMIPTI